MSPVIERDNLDGKSKREKRERDAHDGVECFDIEWKLRTPSHEPFFILIKYLPFVNDFTLSGARECDFVKYPK